MMQPRDKQSLLKLARDTIEAQVTSGGRVEFTPASEALSAESGAFVTLHKHGTLRGCIGTFTSEQPLYETIQEMAVAASTSDPRFPEVSRDEVGDLDIEISVLSPLQRISDLDEIEVGRHGIYMISGHNRGVLLPQVAVEYGWDRDTFLDHTCLKAGLPKDAWKRGGVDIYIFSAEIFSEK